MTALQRLALCRNGALVWATAFLVRLAFLSWQGLTISHDSDQYIQIARNLEQYGVFSGDLVGPVGPWITRDPLYPFFLWVVSAAGLGEWALPAVALAQAALDALTACGVLVLGKKVAGERWAILAAVLYSFHPGAVLHSTALLSETLCAALITAAAVLTTVGEERRRRRWAMAAGCALGATALCRTVFLPLTLAFSVAMLWPGFRRHAGRAALLVACAVAIVLPWSVRSSRIAGRPVAIQEGTRGLELAYLASRSDLDQRDEDQVYAAWNASPEAKQLREARTEEERSAAKQAVREKIVENVLRDPLKFAASRAVTVPRVFVTSFGDAIPGNTAFVAAAREGRWGLIAAKGLLGLVFAIVPLLLAAIGVPVAMSTPAGRFATATWVYTLLIYAPLYVVPRYGQPAVPLLLVGSAIGGQWASALVHRFLARRRFR